MRLVDELVELSRRPEQKFVENAVGLLNEYNSNFAVRKKVVSDTPMIKQVRDVYAHRKNPFSRQGLDEAHNLYVSHIEDIVPIDVELARKVRFSDDVSSLGLAGMLSKYVAAVFKNSELPGMKKAILLDSYIDEILVANSSLKDTF